MKQSASTMLEHSRASRRALLNRMLADAPSNAQTDRQTYKHQLTKRNYLPLGIARRGADQFLRFGGETADLVGASRDQLVEPQGIHA